MYLNKIPDNNNNLGYNWKKKTVCKLYYLRLFFVIQVISNKLVVFSIQYVIKS